MLNTSNFYMTPTQMFLLTNPNGRNWKKRHRQHGRAALSARSIRIRRFADSDTSMRFGRNQNTFFSVFHRSVCTSHWLQFNNNFCIFSLTVRCDKVVLFRIFFFLLFSLSDKQNNWIPSNCDFGWICYSLNSVETARKQEKREKIVCSFVVSIEIHRREDIFFVSAIWVYIWWTHHFADSIKFGKGDSWFGAIFGLQNIWWKCWMDFCWLLSSPIEQVQESILLRLEVTPPSSIEFNSWCLKWQFFSLSLSRLFDVIQLTDYLFARASFVIRTVAMSCSKP